MKIKQCWTSTGRRGFWYVVSPNTNSLYECWAINDRTDAPIDMNQHGYRWQQVGAPHTVVSNDT